MSSDVEASGPALRGRRHPFGGMRPGSPPGTDAAPSPAQTARTRDGPSRPTQPGPSATILAHASPAARGGPVEPGPDLGAGAIRPGPRPGASPEKPSPNRA